MTDQCAYKWGEQILTIADASEDDDPMDNIIADKNDVPNYVDGDHTHPDEGDVPKTPEEGDVQKSQDEKMSKRISEKMFMTMTDTFQTGIPAGKTMNQLAVPAGKKPKTTVNSLPTAKIAKSKVEKKKAESPEVAKSMSEKPNDAQTYMSVDRFIEELKVATTELKTKVKEMEFNESTTQTRLVMLDIKSSPMITAEPPEPNVTTDAAPSTEVTSEASKDLTTLTPTAAEENPAVDKSEEAKEEETDEPIETPATGTPTPPAATEASPTFEPGGNKTASVDIVPTLVVIPEQNRKSTKNNQAAQVQETFSKMGAFLTVDDDTFTGRAFPFHPDHIGPASDDTKVPDMPGTTAGAINEPEVAEPCANDAQASMTSYKASTMAGPGTDPPEVAREGTKEEDVTKVSVTQRAKIPTPVRDGDS